MNLFYNPNVDQNIKEISFDKEESRHILKVLRLKEGDSLKITNGKGIFFDVEIIGVNPKQCIVKVINIEHIDVSSYQLHLAVAPTKLNDRYEWFLEKAAEIGISEITPIICDHSERKIIKPDRYEKILQSAIKQSLKAFMPVLNPTTTFKDFVSSKKLTDETKYIAHCEDSKKESLKSVLRPNQKLIILIGPEGDFSAQEIELAKEAGFQPVTLGDSRLRTETAAIVACHSVAFVNEQ